MDLKIDTDGIAQVSSEKKKTSQVDSYDSEKKERNVNQKEERAKTLISSIEVWAKTPMVRNALLNPDNPEMIDPVNRTFADIVRSDPIFQTFNLYNTHATMIASSTPERVHVQMAQAVVRKRSDFIAALAGKPAIKGPFIGLSSAQPTISLSVPVVLEERVIGVLRPVVGIANFNEVFLKPLMKRQEGKIFIFAPDLDAKGKLKPLDPTLVINIPYISPDIPSIPELLKHKQGVVRYTRSGVKCCAAFRRLEAPRVLVMVELPLSKVRAPIQYIKYAAVAIGLIMLVMIWFPAGMAIRPLLSNLRKCLEFIRTIRDGHMEKRLQVKTHDDVGELAGGLNEMVERLQTQRVDLEESEMKYRSIFETAVEGIFQTNEEGMFLAANPALADILGVESIETLFTFRGDDFYADPKQREEIMDILRPGRKVSRYEFDVKRLDGEIRKCLVHARAQMDKDGRLVMIQGIMHDVTDERRVEAAQQQVETAEKLALQARLKALRYQINPHFLFNVLNTIDVLSRKTPQHIPDLLQELAAYLRYTIKPGTGMWVILNEEIQSIKNYLAVEQVRFRDHLNVNFVVDSDAGEVKAPDMLLQPLVENAIKHGMRTSDMPLKVVVKAEIRGEHLLISVENTGRWLAQNHSRPGRHGIGLENLRERLEIFYNNRFSLETREENGWVRIEIRLPLKNRLSFHSPQ